MRIRAFLFANLTRCNEFWIKLYAMVIGRSMLRWVDRIVVVAKVVRMDRRVVSMVRSVMCVMVGSMKVHASPLSRNEAGQ